MGWKAAQKLIHHWKILRGDNVMIIRGKDRGETGTIKRVIRSQNRVIVEGKNLVKKHIKQGQGHEGGIFTVEAPLHVSNVQIVDPVTKQPCKVGIRYQEDGTKVRVARGIGASGAIIPRPEILKIRTTPRPTIGCVFKHTSTSEVKDDAKKTELPPSSSSLSVSLGFGDQFLKTSSDTSLIGTVKDSTDYEISSLIDVNIQSEVSQIQSPTVLRVPVSMIAEPSVLTPILETPLATTVNTSPHPFVSTIPHVPLQQQSTTPPITTDAPTVTTAVFGSNALLAVELRVEKLEKDVSDLKIVDHSSEALVVLKSQVPTVVDSYLDTKVRDVFQNELQKHTADLSLQHLPELTKKQTPTINLEQESKKSPLEILNTKKEQAEKQQMPKFTIKSTNKAALEENDLKSALYQSMNANKFFNKNPANNRLYHALMEALIADEDAMDNGVADTVKDYKRKHDDDDDDHDEGPSARPNQGKQTKRRRTKESESSKNPSSTKETPKGKAPTKGSKTGTSASTKELVEEPIAEVVMDDTGDDVGHDEDQPQQASQPRKDKTP
ncbi:ribonuclease H-like domain-containing protein [Tanacetum coccineum]